MPNTIATEHPRRSHEQRADALPLTINLFPAILSTDTARLWVGKWVSTEHAETLSSRSPGLTTWRDRDDGTRLYAWNASRRLASDGPPGFQEVTVSLKESPPLFQKLLTDAINVRFRELGFTEKAGGFVNYGRKSLVADIPALAATAKERIGIYAKITSSIFWLSSTSNGSRAVQRVRSAAWTAA